MEFKFSALSIFELGQTISTRLKNDGVTQESELCIYVNKEQFRKVDEDLFYRNKTDESQEFVPSEGEIIVNFGNLIMTIKESEE